MDYKRCPCCGFTLHVSEFSRDKWAKDGLQGWCKICQNERAKFCRAFDSGNPRFLEDLRYTAPQIGLFSYALDECHEHAATEA